MGSTRFSLSAIGVISVFVLLAGACSSQESSSAEPAAEAEAEQGAEETNDAAEEAPYMSEVYADNANWLCRPDVDNDACDVDLDATLVAADGTKTVQPFEPQTDAPIDCFYLYPTISTDEGANSDLIPGDGEKGMAAGQAARFGEVCNVYAPMYPQIPLGALFDRIEGTDEESEEPEVNPREVGYAGVEDAFEHYMANDNNGKPFVLMGHSQGAGMLSTLIDNKINDDEELRSQMLSALLIGGAVRSADEGEQEFSNIGECESETDTGCIISYASFYEAEPPPESSFFGAPRTEDGEPGGRAVCSNPGDLSGAAAPLNSYYEAGHHEEAPAVDTAWIRYDGLVIAECQSDDSFDWLQITVENEESDVRPTDLGGRITPEWGTHLMDVHLGIGNLVEIVRAQSAQA